MEVIFLGVGSAFSKKNYNTNMLLYSNNTNLLIDCGYTAGMSLHKLGMSFKDINNIIITHIHGDHCGGLEEAAFTCKYVHNKKINLFIPAQIWDELWTNTLKGSLMQNDGQKLELSDYFNIYIIKDYVNIDGIEVNLIPSNHMAGKKCYSLIINKKLFYSSDTKFNEELLLKLPKVIEYIFHDCQLFDGGVHSSFNELLTLPIEIRQKIYLMHYGDNFEDFYPEEYNMRFLKQHNIYELINL